MIEPLETDNGTLEITADTERLRLIVGGHEIEPLLDFPSTEKDLDTKISLLRKMGIEAKTNDLTDGANGDKLLHQFFARHLGPGFNRRMTAISHRVFIEPLGGSARHIARSKGWGFYYPLHKLADLKSVLTEVQQAEKDGIANVVPLIISLKKGPHELKKIFGKGLWSKIANASMAQNKRTAWAIDNFSSKHEDITNDEIRSIGAAMMETKAWAQRQWLSGSISFNLNYLKWLSLNGKTEAKERRRLSGGLTVDRVPSRATLDGFRIYRDCCSMAQRLGLAEKVPKTIKATEKWHEDLIRRVNESSLAQYSRERFKRLPGCQSSVEITLRSGSVATVSLLTSPYLVAKEGIEMRHCIVTRIQSVEEGASIVGRISTPSGNASAEWLTSGGVQLLEVSGRFNEEPPPECVEAGRLAAAWIGELYSSDGVPKDSVYGH